MAHPDSQHTKPVTIEWRNDVGKLIYVATVPVGRLIRTVLADMTLGAVFLVGDTITFREK